MVPHTENTIHLRRADESLARTYTLSIFMSENQISINARGRHVQLLGEGHYNEFGSFTFYPGYPEQDMMPRFRGMGMATLLPDGTFDFVPRRRTRSAAQLIRKLTHGRLSKSKDGAILLTLKVSLREPDLDVADAIYNEAYTAYQTLRSYFAAEGERL